MMISVPILHVNRVSQANILFRIRRTSLQEALEGLEAICYSSRNADYETIAPQKSLPFNVVVG